MDYKLKTDILDNKIFLKSTIENISLFTHPPSLPSDTHTCLPRLPSPGHHSPPSDTPTSLVSLGFCCSVVNHTLPWRRPGLLPCSTSPETVTVKRDKWRMMKCPDVTCLIIRRKRRGLRCRGRMQLRVSVTERHSPRTKQPCIPPFAILTINVSEMVSP